MMLTGPEIQRQVEAGAIVIDPFDPKRLNPNSYNLRLGREMMTYEPGATLSTRRSAETRTIAIPPNGYTLYPRVGYLCVTMEWTETAGFVPVIEGRSSIGRLFLLVHATAGFGDDGFRGRWTLELVPLVHPVRVFEGDEICQISFHRLEGVRKPYCGKYQDQRGPIESRMHLEHIRRHEHIPPVP